MGRINFFNWRSLPYRLLRRIALPPRLYWRGARLVNDRFLLGVIGIIRDEEQRVLLFQHTYRRKPWGLPGGWMRTGESPLMALEREVYEETRLRVRSQRLLLVGTSTDRPKMEFVVSAELVGGKFRASAEVSAARWWPLGEIPYSSRIQPILEAAAYLRPDQVGYYSHTWRDERAADRNA